MARNTLATLSFIAAFFALGVITLGAYTRLIDAGLGCPDWPGCYGQLTVPFSDMAKQLANLNYPGSHLVIYKAWAEMIHRYFVGALSFLILAIEILIFSQKKFRFRSNIIFAIILFLLLTYQIILGQLTVTLKLLPIVVSQHLLGGFLILSILWLIYLNNSKKSFPYNSDTRKLLLGGIIIFLILLLQISLGAWTSTNYASLSCPDFPFCQNNQPFMTFYFKEAFTFFSPLGINYEGGVLPEVIRKTIQMSHRLGAFILTLGIFIYSALAIPKLSSTPLLLKSMYLILGLLIIQIGIGISNVIFKLPLISAIAHTLIAALLLLAVITFLFNLNLSRK